MLSRTASCSCGALSVITNGEPVRISVCHCQACQRRSGSPFAMQARFPTPDVQITGVSSQYLRVAESGAEITFHFCPECGATVWYQINTALDLIAVPVGAFADPQFPAPRVSVYERHKHSWVRLPEDIHREA